MMTKYIFEETQIGSHITTNFICIDRTDSVKEAMNQLLVQARNHDNIETLYIIEPDGTYYGILELKKLLAAKKEDSLETLIVRDYPYLYADEETEDCASELKEYEEDSIPVLDRDKHIVGVITASETANIIDDELGDDYAKLAGLSEESDLDEPITVGIKKRLPWLILLLFLGMGVSTVVGVFENIVQQITLIVCFQSLILDMAGNVGTQSLAVTIRVLMDEHISFAQKIKLIFKEMRVGLANGLILGAMALIFITGYIMLFKHENMIYALAVAGCVGAALIISMVISSLIGTLTPIIFDKVNIDPAVASGPLITTVNDLVAVVTYYGLAGIFLIEIMHL
mgnify:FL=1